MNLRQAAQQALEALEQIAKYENPQTKIQVRKKDGSSIVTMYPHKVASDAAQALRTALAEPEQEPVAWMHTNGVGHHYFRLKPQDKVFKPIPLYTHPPQRKPLSDEDIVDLWADVSMDYDDQINIIEMARAIERAHGIGGEA